MRQLDNPAYSYQEGAGQKRLSWLTEKVSKHLDTMFEFMHKTSSLFEG